MTAAPNGASIFPLALVTTPQPPEYFVDNNNQLVELIASQCASATPTLTNGGTFTANGTTAVTVTNAAVTANSQILFTLKTAGGTVGATPSVKTITPGTGFTVVGTASDTSVYNYSIIG
jgi:hypothetical protein